MSDPHIDAAPTKDFFIHMLVRDIELIAAIGDLVDNCVDGARRLRGVGELDDLFVRISVDEHHFRIEDNCGGIPVDVAEKYAFRFGRPDGMQDTPHSIGQFGVGMKRALFKLGNRFVIRSFTEADHFAVDVNVADWREDPAWRFEFTERGTSDHGNEPGTSIEVTELHEDSRRSFQQQAFITRMARTLGLQHQESLAKGLVLTVNAAPVGGPTLQLLGSAQLSPATQTLRLFEDTPSPVIVRIYAGIVDRSHPPEAGWYVYCNGRLVLEAEKTRLTGWGVREEDLFPQFHNRYGRFRGYVFFDSDDASKLPWTTTKTDISPESAVYQKALQAMRLAGRPVTQFLYDLSVEIEKPPEEGTELARIVEQASSTPLPPQPTDTRFGYTRPAVKPRPTVRTQSIQYKRPLAEIEEAKRLLGVDSAAEVGQRTFEYFMKREGE